MSNPGGKGGEIDYVPGMRCVDRTDYARWLPVFREFFEYRDGMLFWKKKGSDKVNVGDRAGYTMPSSKRRRIRLCGNTWLEHRVIFLMHHEFMPEEVDHIDCDKTNNSILNLRAATRAENSRNVGKKTDNTSGHKNVSWKKERSKWKVEIKVDGRCKFIGYFDNLELAGLVAKEARDLYHGRFARHV